jgi:hypothetical protein
LEEIPAEFPVSRENPKIIAASEGAHAEKPKSVVVAGLDRCE